MEDDNYNGPYYTKISELWTIAKFRKKSEEISRNINLQLFCELLDVIAATRGLFGDGHVILNHGQVTWTTPELAPSPLTTTPHQRGTFQLSTDLTCIATPYTAGLFNGIGLELLARQATVRYPIPLGYHGRPLCRRLNLKADV
ncbi:hypothetical protein TNCV_2891101 [Trichonephila clavipes]|nr:hypothetical protein TNCV_2891101 [Trichonephila clavipes]